MSLSSFSPHIASTTPVSASGNKSHSSSSSSSAAVMMDTSYSNNRISKMGGGGGGGGGDEKDNNHHHHHHNEVIYSSPFHNQLLLQQQQQQQQQETATTEENNKNGISTTTPTTPYHHTNNTNNNIPTIGQFYMLNHGTTITTNQQQKQHPPPPTIIPSLRKEYQYLYVLPVLLIEFLAIALTRAVLPSILLKAYPTSVYLVLGIADCIKGILAFYSCPKFGQISDIYGRKVCLFITVLGTCAPVCSLALFNWNNYGQQQQQQQVIMTTTTTLIDIDNNNNINGGGGGGFGDVWSASEQQQQEIVVEESNINPTTTTTMNHNHHNNHEYSYELPPMAIELFVVLLSLSGIFSSTFPLVFAYISDTVPQQKQQQNNNKTSSPSSSSNSSSNDRVAAYGLALATFGLSFTIGPMAGGYLAKYNTHYVFMSSLLLTILDLAYIYFILPESKKELKQRPNNYEYGRVIQTTRTTPMSTSQQQQQTNDNDDPSTVSSSSIMNNFLKQWDFTTTIKLIVQDPFLKHVGQVAFLYYIGLYAVISTLSLYAVQQFHLSTERLGELMSALGLCTMIAEAVLVRILVPLLGEKRSTRIGLLSFAFQCFVLGGATESWHLFVCVAFSLLGNLVYPSLSSLVSSTVEPNRVGEALGAMNGIKALTEGLGPLLFGALMTVSENSSIPGWPYWIASLFVLGAYHVSETLPDGNYDDDGYIFLNSLNDDDDDDDDDNNNNSKQSTRAKPPPRYYNGKDDYVHELEFKQRRIPTMMNQTTNQLRATATATMMVTPPPSTSIVSHTPSSRGCLDTITTTLMKNSDSYFATPMRDDENEEYQGLLSLSEIDDVDSISSDEES